MTRKTLVAVLLAAALTLPAGAASAAPAPVQVDCSGLRAVAPVKIDVKNPAPVSAPRRAAELPATVKALLEDAARDMGLDPRLLAAVARVESGGNHAARSPAGALGVMQLMPGTARGLGVNAHSLRDNIRGGAMYLRQQLDKYKSIPLALAAYNAGPGAVDRYGGIPPFPETRAYVARVLALMR